MSRYFCNKGKKHTDWPLLHKLGKYNFFKVRELLHLSSGVNEAKRLQALLERTQNLCSVEGDRDKHQNPKKQVFAAHPDLMSSDDSLDHFSERARSDDSLLTSARNQDNLVTEAIFSHSGKFCEFI